MNSSWFDRCAPISAKIFGFLLCTGLSVAGAEAQIPLPVGNHSFESPATTFAWPDATEWEETGPVSEDPQLPGVEDTLDTGVFFNSPVDGKGQPSPFFITNADGSQLGFIGAKDDDYIAFFQQLPIPFEAGANYEMKLDVGESFFFPPLTFNPNDPDPPPDPDPALLGLRLYYEDGAMQHVTVAQRIVSAEEMPDGPDAGLLLVEFATTTGALEPADASVGFLIGIEIRPLDGLSGVWNVDNAQMSVTCSLGVLAGDVDLDGDRDLVDYDSLAVCMTGPGDTERPTLCPPCAFGRLDSDTDGDLDLRDVASFMIEFDD